MSRVKKYVEVFILMRVENYILDIRRVAYSPCMVLYPRVCIGYRVSNYSPLKVKGKV